MRASRDAYIVLRVKVIVNVFADFQLVNFGCWPAYGCNHEALINVWKSRIHVEHKLFHVLSYKTMVDTALKDVGEEITQVEGRWHNELFIDWIKFFAIL